MEPEEEVEVQGGNKVSWVQVLPWDSMICHFLPAPEDSGGTFGKETSPWPMETWSGCL